MTPLQEWYARTNATLIPAADLCLARFRGRLNKLRRDIAAPYTSAHAQPSEQTLTRLLGEALYFARKEAERLDIPFEKQFGWLLKLAAQEKGAHNVLPSFQWPRSTGLRHNPDGPGLSEADETRLGLAIRQSVLAEGALDEAGPVELATPRPCLFRHLIRECRKSRRLFHTRIRGQLTQLWETDEFSNPLWFVALKHPRRPEDLR